MRALIVGSVRCEGSAGLVRGLASRSDLVVAADGGGRTLAEAGIRPHLLIGDADSVDATTLEAFRDAGVEMVVFPADKDRTDLDLALEAARDRGATDVTVTGAVGGRLDHTLATLGSVLRHIDLRPVIAEPGLTAWVLDPAHRSEVTFTPDTVVSVMSLKGTSSVSSEGLHWPLDGLDLALFDPRGVSNRPQGDRVTLRISRGTALVTTGKDDSAIHTPR